MLQDVILRTVALGEEIGCRGLLVHTETIEARDFHLHLVPEFETSPTDQMHLYLLMKDIRRTLHETGGVLRRWSLGRSSRWRPSYSQPWSWTWR